MFQICSEVKLFRPYIGAFDLLLGGPQEVRSTYAFYTVFFDCQDYFYVLSIENWDYCEEVYPNSGRVIMEQCYREPLITVERFEKQDIRRNMRNWEGRDESENGSAVSMIRDMIMYGHDSVVMGCGDHAMFNDGWFSGLRQSQMDMLLDLISVVIDGRGTLLNEAE